MLKNKLHDLKKKYTMKCHNILFQITFDDYD